MMTIKQLAALALAAGAILPAAAATDVAVSIGIAQPGVYGRIDIGTLPPPRVVYPQPVIYAPPPVTVVQAPLYLYVPPGHQKHWGKHCARYNACARPVYFVQESWVQERYEREGPHGQPEGNPGKKHGNGKSKGGQGNG